MQRRAGDPFPEAAVAGDRPEREARHAKPDGADPAGGGDGHIGRQEHLRLDALGDWGPGAHGEALSCRDAGMSRSRSTRRAT
eukprot:1941057-Alexandrium_andersonii.AAC.1